jgi:hypothetical protein
MRFLSLVVELWQSVMRSDFIPVFFSLDLGPFNQTMRTFWFSWRALGIERHLLSPPYGVFFFLK